MRSVAAAPERPGPRRHTMNEPRHPSAAHWRQLLRSRLADSRPGDPARASIAGLPVAQSARLQGLLPVAPVRAAVLVPIIDRPEGPTLLFIERAAALRSHAGQIAFPGGRVDATDEDVVATALREAQEEVGIEGAGVEVLGFLGDHYVLTGYQITPVVGLLAEPPTLRLAPSEVADCFEVPLSYAFDPTRHVARLRRLGETAAQFYDIPFGRHRIWGATAGMVLSLARALGLRGEHE